MVFIRIAGAVLLLYLMALCAMAYWMRETPKERMTRLAQESKEAEYREWRRTHGGTGYGIF